MKVYISTDAHTQTYHTDKDCRSVKNIESVDERQLENVTPIYEPCYYCVEENDPNPSAQEEQVCKICGRTFKNIGPHYVACLNRNV